MRISKNAMLNLLLARQNDTMSDHTNDILLSSMGGTLSLIGSKNLYDALDTKVKDKEEAISKLENELKLFPDPMPALAKKVYSTFTDQEINKLKSFFNHVSMDDESLDKFVENVRKELNKDNTRPTESG